MHFLKKTLRQINLTHILILLSIGIIIMAFFFPATSFIQLSVAMFFVISYVTVALVHHYLDKSLTVEAIFEYILIATLATVILVGTLA